MADRRFALIGHTHTSGGAAEVNDLSDVVTWANVPDANITEGSVTQHAAAISTALSLNVANWDTAYGWGDHSGAYLPIGGGTLTGNLTVDLGATNSYLTIGNNAVTGNRNGVLQMYGEWAGVSAGFQISVSSANVGFSGIGTDPAVNIQCQLGFDILGGKTLQIRDSDNDAYGNFTHDGAGFNTDFVGTNVWDIKNLSSGMRLRDGAAFTIFDSNDTNSAILVHDGTNFNLTHTGTTSFDIESLSGAVRLINTAGLDIRDAGGLTIRSADDTHTAIFSHDGTDFNTSFGATTDWNLTGLTNIQLDASLAATGAVTGASFGGIVSTNLVDKSTIEAISGNWNFSSTALVLSGHYYHNLYDATNMYVHYYAGAPAAPTFANLRVSDGAASYKTLIIGGDGTLDFDGIISGTNIFDTNWDNAYSWGDHSVAGYASLAASANVFTGLLRVIRTGGAGQDYFHLRDDTEANDLYFRYDGADFEIRSESGGGGHQYMKFVSDGTLVFGGAISGSNLNIANWDTAYGWDDHGTQGYLTAVQAGDVDAEASTDGWVLTSDGAGNAAWEAVPAGGGGWAVGDADMYFAAAFADKISMYDDRLGDADMYGFGIESSCLYTRSGSTIRWYINTVADGGTSDVMQLNATDLTVNADLSAVSGTFTQPVSGLDNTINLNSTGPGIFFFENDRGTDLGAWKLYATASQFRLYTASDAGSASDAIWNVVRDGTTTGGQQTWYHGGLQAMNTQKRTDTGHTSMLQIRDHQGSIHDAGFNVLDQEANNTSFTLGAQHCGMCFIKSTSTARTLTLPATGDADFPTDGVMTVYNRNASGNITINATTNTITIHWHGSALVSGVANRTIAPGGVCTLHRQSTGVFAIYGAGIS